MKIAVLLSTYNAEKYLNDQLASLAGQTVKDSMTIYVRDDGSSDRTFEIIEKWKSKLAIVLRKGINIGPAKSFWELFTDKTISADYYAFCDQDDVWDADKLEEGIRCLQTGCQLYCCNCRIINAAGEILDAQMQTEKPRMELPRTFVTGFVQGCAMVFTDEFRNNLLGKKITCIPMHDLLMTQYALAEKASIYWDNIPRFSYRMHQSNVLAKREKSPIKKLIHTWITWNDSRINTKSVVAAEMLDNCANLSEEDHAYLLRMRDYRKSFGNKLWLIRYETVQDIEYRALRSYKIRILFNLL